MSDSSQIREIHQETLADISAKKLLELQKTLKELIEEHLPLNHPVRKKFEEIAKEVPKELIYDTNESKDGYCHDDVWILMDLLHDKIGVRVEDLENCFGIGNDDEEKCRTCSARGACLEESEARSEHYYMVG